MSALSFWVGLAAAGAGGMGGMVAGCSNGDDSSTPFGSDGGADATREAAGDDAGADTDAGADSTAPGFDASATPDSSGGSDTGAAETGSESDATAGDDGGPGPSDAGPSDAATIVEAGADGGTTDGGATGACVPGAGLAGDAALPTYTFANPLQIDLSSVFNIDSVANTSPTGESYPPLSPMDGAGNGFMTTSAATALSASSDAGCLNQWCGGLPDNGLFAADSNHPNVQMAFNDTSVAPNSALLGGSYPSSVTFPIGPTSFSSLQLYLTSTEGASNTEVWLQYTDCTTDSINVTVPDWYNGLANAPLYLVQGNLSRFSSAGSDGSYSYWLYGVNVAVNPAKILKSVSVANYSSGSRLVLYGATAYDAGASSASDAGPDAEAGQPVGFSNPVQITGIPVNADIVETTATGGAPLTAMDGAGNGNVFPTASVVTAAGMGFPASLGLPDNAQFAGDGTNIPPVQLAWNNSANVLNSILVSDTLGTTFQCSIPPGPYTNLQIYATGGNGPSMISYTLTYSDGSTSVASAHVPDWCTSTPPPGTYPLIKVFRYSTLTSKVDPSVQCGIWAIDLSPDPSKMLTQISFVDQIDPTNPNPNANLIFFGATAW